MADAHPGATAPATADATLVLHVGARRVSRDELAAVPCPPAEGRWRPVKHVTVLDYAVEALEAAGYGIQKEDLGLSRDNARFFGTLTLQHTLVEGAALAVGIRSSTDRSISLQWAAGSRVFVCDNLAFSSSVVIARKHTTHGIDRYQEAIAKAVAGLGEFSEAESRRIRVMQETACTDEHAESLLLRAFEQGLIGYRALPVALDEWRAPTHDLFDSRTLWRLYNACTFAMSRRIRTNPQAHALATIKLGSLLLPHDPAAREAAVN